MRIIVREKRTKISAKTYQVTDREVNRTKRGAFPSHIIDGTRSEIKGENKATRRKKKREKRNEKKEINKRIRSRGRPSEHVLCHAEETDAVKLCSTIWYHANVGAAAITTRSVCDSRERKRGTHKAAKCSSPFSYSASEVEKVREMYPRGGSLSGGIIKGRQNSPVSGGAVEMSRDFSARQREVKERGDKGEEKTTKRGESEEGRKKIGGREEGKE